MLKIRASGLSNSEVRSEVSVDGEVDCRPSGLCNALSAFDDAYKCWGQDNFPSDSGSSGDFHGLEFTYRHKASGRTYGVTLEATNEPDVAALECSRRGFLCPVFAYRGSIGTC